MATISNSGVVSGVSAGTSTITYVDNNDCLTTLIVTVTAGPTPVITGSSSYCAGSFTTLSTSTPYSSYSWSTEA